jgi:DNA-binding beta-propeller fold protein YncE
VTTDAEGRIYVSDTSMDAVMVFTPARRFIKSIGTGGTLKQPVGLAVDDERKRLYVVDAHKHHVVVFDLETGETIRTIGRRGRGEGSFNYPQRIALDPAGNLHIVDTMNGRVQIFDSEGRFLRAFGKLGDGPGNFARPKGIDIDSEGHIYVVDAAFNNVQIFDGEGRILLAFGQYGEGRGDMVLPAGLAIDGEDQIYVIDQWGARVNIYEFMGETYKAREGKKEQVKK